MWIYDFEGVYDGCTSVVVSVAIRAVAVASTSYVIAASSDQIVVVVVIDVSTHSTPSSGTPDISKGLA